MTAPNPQNSDDIAPVIVIGAARSGTKILRDILASGPGSAAVPYDVNYVWRYGAEGAPDDMLDPGDLTPRRRDFIRKTLPRLAGAGRGEVMVEKTVSNTLRVPFVDAVFPNARYVHLIRDGRDVTESAMRQWQAPPDWSALWTKLRGMPLSNLGYVAWFAGNMVKGFTSGRGGGKVWGPRFAGIEEVAEAEGLAAVCARQWVASVTAARTDLAALPNARVHEIRYEDMVANPALLGDLARDLGLPDPEGIARTARARLKPGHGAAWQDLPADSRTTILDILTPTLTDLGYGETNP